MMSLIVCLYCRNTDRNRYSHRRRMRLPVASSRLRQAPVAPQRFAISVDCSSGDRLSLRPLPSRDSTRRNPARCRGRQRRNRRRHRPLARFARPLARGVRRDCGDARRMRQGAFENHSGRRRARLADQRLSGVDDRHDGRIGFHQDLYRKGGGQCDTTRRTRHAFGDSRFSSEDRLYGEAVGDKLRNLHS